MPVAYAIFWTLVVIAAAIGLAYFFINTGEDSRRRTAAGFKDRTSWDMEFGRSLGLEEEAEADVRDAGRARTPRQAARSAERTEAWNESEPASAEAVRSGMPGIHQSEETRRSTDPEAARAEAKAALGESAALVAMDDSKSDKPETDK